MSAIFHGSLPRPLVSAQWLAGQSPSALCILDATVDLPSPRFDGDYRLHSGAESWRNRHILGSRHADLVVDLSIAHPLCSFMHPSKDMLAAALARLGVADEKTVVIYDGGSGLWAARLWWMLRAIGIDALVLDGGLPAWERAGYPVSSEAAGISEKRTLSAVERHGLWVERAEVEALLKGEGTATLVCALPAAVFAGVAPTRYARRGHIPGSLNLPARQFFAGDGCYLPVPELLRLAGQVLPEKTHKIWLYCGGGIAASAAALVLTMLGRENLAIYDGSLQEWSDDPALPLLCQAQSGMSA